MLSTDYVWIAMDWLSFVLNSSLFEADNIKSLQGVISLHSHTPNSGHQRIFRQRWIWEIIEIAAKRKLFDYTLLSNCPIWKYFNHNATAWGRAGKVSNVLACKLRGLKAHLVFRCWNSCTTFLLLTNITSSHFWIKGSSWIWQNPLFVGHLFMMEKWQA